MFSSKGTVNGIGNKGRSIHHFTGSREMTDRTWRYSVVMTMVSLAWLLPVIATATPFPRDLQPISVVGLEDSLLYPSFQGLMSHNNSERLGLDYQRMIRIQHMLYIAARSFSLAGLFQSVRSHAFQITEEKSVHQNTCRLEKPLELY